MKLCKCIKDSSVLTSDGRELKVKKDKYYPYEFTDEDDEFIIPIGNDWVAGYKGYFTFPLAKYDLMFASLGNGISVCNMKQIEAGDYKKLAHIAVSGEVTYYVDDLPLKITELIQREALRYFKDLVNSRLVFARQYISEHRNTFHLPGEFWTHKRLSEAIELIQPI
jgi:hypothetical protein